ncbi:MAG: hypothetical protein ABFD84_07140 [Candidatus Polarisedimenticolia bacterium]|nr:hypothetical protein [bacterium]
MSSSDLEFARSIAERLKAQKDAAKPAQSGGGYVRFSFGAPPPAARRAAPEPSAAEEPKAAPAEAPVVAVDETPVAVEETPVPVAPEAPADEPDLAAAFERLIETPAAPDVSTQAVEVVEAEAEAEAAEAVVVEAEAPAVEAVVVEAEAPVVEAVEPESEAPVVEAVEPEAEAPVVEAIEPEAEAPVVEAIEPEAEAPIVEAIEPEAEAPIVEAVEPEAEAPIVEAIEVEAAKEAEAAPAVAAVEASSPKAPALPELRLEGLPAFGPQAWDALLDWCIAAAGASEAFAMEGQGLPIAVRGTDEEARLGAVGTRAVMALGQAKLMGLAEEAPEQFDVYAGDKVLSVIAVDFGADQVITVGVVGTRPVAPEARRKIGAVLHGWMGV